MHLRKEIQVMVWLRIRKEQIKKGITDLQIFVAFATGSFSATNCRGKKWLFVTKIFGENKYRHFPMKLS